jgi:hypothetical protein
LVFLFVLFVNSVTASCYNASADPIPLCSCEDLNLTRVDDTADYQLQNNIDCSNTSVISHSLNYGGAGWLAVGSNADRFPGTLDGDGYNISNLWINRSSTDYQGLFGVLTTGSEVKNLGLVNFTINGSIRTGGLAGANWGGTINNSFSTGYIEGNYFIGGLVGHNTGTINHSYSSVDAYGYRGNPAYIGSLIGYTDGGKVEYSYATGNVVSTNSRVGGLAGEIYQGYIKNSYAIGNVTGSSTTGGLVGISTSATISTSYALGNVTSSGSSIGGLVGFMQSSAIVNNSFARGNVSATSSTGGLVGYKQISSVIENSYSTGTTGDDGFMGQDSGGSCDNNFWDNQTSGVTTDSNNCATGKITSDMKNIETFTDLLTVGLTTAWDFLNNPNNDSANLDFWHIDPSINDGYPFLLGFGFANLLGDIYSPTITINIPNDNSFSTDTNLDINFTVTDAVGVDSCWYSNDTMSVNNSLASCANITLVTWSEGQHNVTIWANDTSNNIGSDTVSFSIDNVVPLVGFNNPSDDDIVSNSLIINVTVNDSISGVDTVYFNITNSSDQIAWLQSTNISEEWNYTYDLTSLPSGYYNITVYANDTVGNLNNSISINFIVDNTTPLVGFNNPSEGESVSDSLIINITANDTYSDIDTVYFNITNSSGQISWLQATNISNEWNYTYDLTNLSNGYYNITAYANDTLGNLNDSILINFYVNNTDGDGDGVIDALDTLLYNESNVVTSGITTLNITVGGNSTVGSFLNVQKLLFYDESDLIINFSHNFSSSNFDLNQTIISKTSNSILVNLSGQLQNSYNKTLYLDDNSFVGLCVKNEEISSIDQISSNCDGSNEIDFDTCIGNSTGVTISGVTCTDQGSIIKVENLRYSAVLGIQASPSVSSSGGGGSRAGSIVKNMAVYIKSVCVDEPINLIVEGINSNNLYSAKYFVYDGNDIYNDNLILKKVMYRNKSISDFSLIENFNLDNVGTYTILVRSYGFYDVKHTFNISECIKINVNNEIKFNEEELIIESNENKEDILNISLENKIKNESQLEINKSNDFNFGWKLFILVLVILIIIRFKINSDKININKRINRGYKKKFKK